MSSEKKESCGSGGGFSIVGILKAGIVGAILTNILMVLQGNDVLFYFGTLFWGVEGDLKMIYLSGVGMGLVLGVFFAFIYAILLAPIRFLNDLLKAIIFALILTAATYYVFPRLPWLVNRVMGYADKDSVAALVKTSPVEVSAEGQERISRALVISFSNSLIFSLMVVVLYRRRCEN